MLRNYFKTTLRHIRKSKVNFLFKLGGLTLALSSLLIITVYVTYHLSFDTFHNDYQNIYRVNSRWMENGSLTDYAISPGVIGSTLKEAFPEIKSFARLSFPGWYEIRYGEKAMRIHGFVNADTTVFDVFTFRFLRGNRHSLVHPKSIILTESLAKEIFGDEDPMGKAISFTDRSGQTLQVSGIIEDLPSNTHLSIRALLPSAALEDSLDTPEDPWAVPIGGGGPLYIRLDGHSNVDDLLAKAIPLLRTRMEGTEEEQQKHYEILLEPISDIHLGAWINSDFTRKANGTYVYAFAMLGLFLLFIAGINYVNLSIADFHRRSKEIGMRKVLGAQKRQVALHVIGETALITTGAGMLALLIVYLVFPEVVRMLEKDLRYEMLFQTKTVAVVGGTLVLLIAISSLYPAWFLAANKPVNDFKSISVAGKNSAGRVLLLVQFTISVVCLTATFIVGRQINFLQTTDPGFDRINTIVLFMPDRYPTEKIQLIKNEMANVPGVDAVSYSTFALAGGGYYRDWYRVEIEGEMKQMLLNEVFFDHDFFRAMDIELVAGRSFDPANPTDPHSAFIVNEAAVRAFGWRDPIGKKIKYGLEDTEREKWEGTVVGVVKDFNVYSMRRKIEPLVMRLPWSDWPGNCVHIRVTGQLHDTIERIKKKYAEIMPDFLINYQLISDRYDNQYQSEQRAFTSLQLGTWIIVLISALGIFSLSVYLSLKRMKEFGIRKVLGASVHQITILHVGYFLRIAFFANIIALPLAYWLVGTWLSQFAYRTQVDPWIFAGVVILSFALIILSAGYASLRAGSINPVEVIKSDG